MAEIPILMNEFSVKATLARRKTQTRRVMKLQPSAGVRRSVFVRSGFEDGHGRELRCPYGIRGDYLYARETWCGALTKADYTGDPNDHGGENDPCCGYRATMTYKCGKPMPENPFRKWKPSIHMPKKYARLWLVNEGTGIERIQDTSEEDAIAEGVLNGCHEWDCYWATHSTGEYWGYYDAEYPLCHCGDYSPEEVFAKLWNSIYAKPRPVRIKGVIDHYVSYPWDDVQEVGDHRGKLWFIVGNPFVWKLKYSVRGRYD